MVTSKNIINIAFVLLILIFSVSCSSSSKKGNDKTKAALYYRHGTLKLVGKEYSDALNYLRQSNELRPGNSKTLNNLGMTYFFKNDINKAEFYLKKSLDVDKENLDARNNLASIYFKKGHYDLAKKEYLRVNQNLAYKKQFRTLYNLAHIELQNNNTSSAISYLNKSLKEKTDYCSAHFLLGKIYYSQTKFEQSLSHYKQSSMGTCVNNPTPHYHQGLSLIKLQRYIEAKSKFDFIVKNFPTYQFKDQSKKYSNQLYHKITANSGLQINKKSDPIQMSKQRNTNTISSPRF